MLSLPVIIVVATQAIRVMCTQNITSIFAGYLSPGAEIFLPSQTNFTEDVTQRWTTYEAPSYAGAIKPATVGDVQEIVSGSKTSLVEDMF